MDIYHITSHGQSHSHGMGKTGPSTERYCSCTWQRNYPNTGRGSIFGIGDVINHRLSTVDWLIIVPAPMLADSLRFGIEAGYLGGRGRQGYFYSVTLSFLSWLLLLPCGQHNRHQIAFSKDISVTHLTRFTATPTPTGPPSSGFKKTIWFSIFSRDPSDTIT